MLGELLSCSSRLFIEAHQGQSSRLQNPRGTRANEIFRNPLSFERSARLSARTLLRSPVYKHKQPGHVRNAAPQQLTTGDSTHIILDGANICWAYGHALHILGASGDPAAGFPESEVSAVAPDAGNLRGRRPRSAGLLLALDYGPWIAAGHTVEAIIPTSYVEGPLWGLADGFGIPANVFGGWGFSSGRAASRKRRKAMKLANKAKRKADRAAEKTRRVALASKERQRRHGTTSGGPGSGVFGRELCDVFDEVAAADENSLSEEETKDAGHATAGEGPPLEIEADESPAGEECGGDFDNESVPVGTFVLDTSGEALLVKLRQAPRGGGFSTWRNLPLHTALLDGRLMTVDRTEKVEGGRSADDWAILSRAAQTQGMVVSNDRYREHRRMFRYAPGQRVLRVGYEFLQEAETSEGRGLELKFHPHVGVGT